MSTFFGLNIARSGMQAQQKALEVTSHNIANANTPGYSRQVARMVPTTPISYSEGKGMLGSGVVVEEIARVRDHFLDMQIRKELQTLGQWDSRRHVLNQVEQIFMEPSDTGFSTVLGKFFDSWQELSLNPESSPVRATLVQNSSTMINTARHINEQLKTVRSDIDFNIELKVKEVNTLTEQIKDLNLQIIRLVALEEMPSDLMDRRDLLMDRLAEIIEYNAIETERGSVNIYIGGRELVNEGMSFKLKTESGGSDGDWPLVSKIVWERDGREVNMNNGEIAGLRETRDVYLRSYMEDFEALVWGIINIVNDLHEGGMDLKGDQGLSFFKGDYLED
ncbi:MAG: flagellar hook-associated protein FlgK, partial [Candidatus Contubernalis sp.]|nr:flagellar hook-associated protein FlgK [Candidatus Contubernalis sp.]